MFVFAVRITALHGRTVLQHSAKGGTAAAGKFSKA